MKMRCLFLFIWIAAAAGAQTPPVPQVRASGEGSVFAQPDCAKINIGVVSQAPTAQAASSQNAGQLQSVLAKLHDVLGQKSDIRTISYSLNPVYQYPKNGGKPTIDGYSAANIVEVTSDDLANIGKLIDAATAGGANEIRSLQFTLKDERPVRAAALRQAVLEAHANAQAMAGALGLKLGKLLLLEQSSAIPIRPMMAAMATRVAAATPVETQPIEVRASVTLTMAVE
jgi:uncharacterized protein